MIDLEKLRESAGREVSIELSSATMIELLDYIAGLYKDAGRYQWLRKQDDDDFCFAVVKNPHFDVYGPLEELDQAIDTAISASAITDLEQKK